MAFKGPTYCQICEHICFSYGTSEIKSLGIKPGCAIEGCEMMPSHNGGNPFGMHHHCNHEKEHGICTTIGCMPKREDLYVE